MNKSIQKSNLMEVLTLGPARVAVSVLIPILAFVLLRWSFIFMRDSNASKFFIGLVAIVVGIFGVWILYLSMNNLADHFPVKFRDGIRPFIFVGPGLAILVVYLIYPTLNTIILSFLNRKGESFV
ncbi:MAG: hypothetical protein U9N32_04335, partial [Spirochaetota bacterium]|nr:hypothetical protein [Spirochaetota bacterium]